MIRVFPRITNGTPVDDEVFVTAPPLIPIDDIEDRDVYVSCTFTWDRKYAEWLADQWSMHGFNVKLGGPAYDDPGGEFVPGRFLKKGYTITSRGCNNNCWFCFTWKREGKIRELPIREGWRVLDSNLLQCSERHIRAVFAMLKRQDPMPVGFLGGFEASLLEDWHVDLLLQLHNISQIYFAYDTPEDYEPLVRASKMIFNASVATPESHRICCYVLIGYKGDTFEKAKFRLRRVLDLGLTPFAMLYRDEEGKRDPKWISFQAHWANPTR